MEWIQYCSDIGGFLGFVVFYLLLKQRATDKEDLRNDLKTIKDVLYRIDTRLSVFGAQLEERTGR